MKSLLILSQTYRWKVRVLFEKHLSYGLSAACGILFFSAVTFFFYFKKLLSTTRFSCSGITPSLLAALFFGHTNKWRKLSLTINLALHDPHFNSQSTIGSMSFMQSVINVSSEC